MSPYGDGHRPGDRRRRDTSIPGGNRDDDPSIDVAEALGFWAKIFVRHKVKVWSMGMILSAIGGSILTAVLLAPRVTALESSVTTLQSDVAILKQGERQKMFILCTLLDRIDPSAVRYAEGCAPKPTRSASASTLNVWSVLARTLTLR